MIYLWRFGQVLSLVFKHYDEENAGITVSKTTLQATCSDFKT